MLLAFYSNKEKIGLNILWYLNFYFSLYTVNYQVLCFSRLIF